MLTFVPLQLDQSGGTEFDPASITGPETIYRIRGIGALIDE